MLAYAAELGSLETFRSSSITPEIPAAASCRRPRLAFVAVMIGLLYPIYTITGFDASAHTSEEPAMPAITVPRGMLHAVFWSLLFGLFMAASFILAMPDTAARAKEGANAWFNLFAKLPMPPILHHLLAIGIVVANYISRRPSRPARPIMRPSCWRLPRVAHCSWMSPTRT